MASLLKRDTVSARPAELFPRLDRVFDDWFKFFPWRPEGLIRVDEFQDNGVFVIRAELPGIDPEKDVELTLTDNALHIAAVRHEQEESESKGYLRKEIRSGSFRRTIPLPAGVTETDIQASYKDGILEVRIPRPEPEPAKRIPVSMT